MKTNQSYEDSQSAELDRQKISGESLLLGKE